MTQKNLMKAIEARIDELREQRQPLIARLSEISAEIEALYVAPLQRADLLQYTKDYIDLRAAEYLTRKDGLTRILDQVPYPHRSPWPSCRRPAVTHEPRAEPLNMRDMEGVLNGGGICSSVLSDGPLLGFLRSVVSSGVEFDESALLFFFGDIVKAKIETHFESTCPAYLFEDEKRVGPPVAERRARLAQLDDERIRIASQIGTIDAELAEIRSAATASVVRAEPAAPPPPKPFRYLDEREVYRLFDGRNAKALADKFGITEGRVRAIGARGYKPDASFEVIRLDD